MGGAHSIQRFLRLPFIWVFLFFLILPYLMPLIKGYTALASEILIYAMFALGFNLLLSYTGLPSFGHAAFFGIGAYGMAITQLKWAKDLWLGLFMGMIAAGFFAAIVGAIICRKRGIYFSLLTLAFGQMFFFVAFRWDEVTGGETGLTGFGRPPLKLPGLPAIDLTGPMAFYLFTLAVFMIVMLVIWRLVHSPFGSVLQSIKQNEIRAKYLGYNTVFYKWTSFTISGIVSGLAGAMFLLQHGGVFPTYLHWTESGNVVMVTIMGGGVVNFFGPILGAGIFVVLQNALGAFTEHWLFILGLIFIAIIMIIPEGILGLFKRSKTAH
jgi:branched-chain amino acid transport system permease protein